MVIAEIRDNLALRPPVCPQINWCQPEWFQDCIMDLGLRDSHRYGNWHAKRVKNTWNSEDRRTQVTWNGILAGWHLSFVSFWSGMRPSQRKSREYLNHPRNCRWRTLSVVAWLCATSTFRLGFLIGWRLRQKRVSQSPRCPCVAQSFPTTIRPPIAIISPQNQPPSCHFYK